MTSLLELRILEGPNLYFTRATVKVTINVAAITGASDDAALVLAHRIGLRSTRPGAPGSGFRQRFAARAVARLVRAIAAEAGVTRLGVRVRPTSQIDQLVVAFPWRNRGRGIALGEAIALVVDSVEGGSLDEAVSTAMRMVTEAEPGERPSTITPTVPVVAVTGTNGKTTTSRMIAHIARTSGLVVGWSNTDGIYRDGVLVEAGDYSGPSGAGRALGLPGVQLAVTETARGGILLKGMGITRNDVSVVTNVTADHLGLQGIDTVDQLAEVKAVVPRITRRGGWAVLNGDDPRVLAMQSVVVARPWVFSRDPDSPSIREVLGAQGRATTVMDGWITVLCPQLDPDPLIEVVDVPMTLAGLSRFNVENALAAASAGLAVGLAREHVVAGLRSFLPDAEHNPGRMNIFSLPTDGGSVSVVMDLAHNEAGLQALLEIMDGLRPSGGRLLLGLGAVGDRTDELIDALGEIGAKGSDVVAIGHKEHYLRGRTMGEIESLLRAGAARVGVSDIHSHRTEVECLAALVERASAGDVVGLMCHAERAEAYAWIAARGGTPDLPDVLAAKVRQAQGSGR